MQMLQHRNRNISECIKTISNTTTVVNRGGSKYWYVEDKLHCEDGPAVEHLDGHREWYIDGLLHRVNGPAIEFADGDKHWYAKGVRHREDGPAIVQASGGKFWYIDGKRLTQQEFNTIIKQPESTITLEENSEQKWRNANGQLHRIDGPAVVHLDGSKAWYVNGLRHRTDGPAIEYANGNKEYFIKGICINKKDFDDPVRLATIRSKLKGNIQTTDLFNCSNRAGQIEKAYEIALQRVIDGLPSADITMG